MSFIVEVWINQQKMSLECVIWPTEDNNVTNFPKNGIKVY